MDAFWEAWRELRVIESQINFANDDVRHEYTYDSYVSSSDYVREDSAIPDQLIEKYTMDGYVINSELVENNWSAYHEFQYFDGLKGASRTAWINGATEFVQQMQAEFHRVVHSVNFAAEIVTLERQVKSRRVAIEAILLRKMMKEKKAKERIVGPLPLFRKEKWMKYKNKNGQLVGEPSREWKVKQGDILEFHERLFLSSTTKNYMDQRQYFHSTDFEKWVILKIFSKKNGVDIADESASRGEQEILFPIGTKFKVVKIEFDARKDEGAYVPEGGHARGANVYMILQLTEVE